MTRNHPMKGAGGNAVCALLIALSLALAPPLESSEPDPAELPETAAAVPAEEPEIAEAAPTEVPEPTETAEAAPTEVAETTEAGPASAPETTETVPVEVPETVEAMPEQPEPSEPMPQPEGIDGTLPQAEDLAAPADALPTAVSPDPEAEVAEDAFVILGQPFEPGELRQFNWQLEKAMTGLAVPTPVLVAHGRDPGPTLCLVAAVHGDELNGVEMVRRIIFGLNRDKLAGNVIGVPIANAFGFLRSSRYLPDRRDLNRHFPGTPGGSLASRFAYALFDEVIRRCEILVDIHTGSFQRTNLPQLRADLTIGPVLNLTKQFGDIAVLHDMSPTGSLRRAATDVGIAAVTLEAGGPGVFQESAVDAGVKAIEALLNHLEMQTRFRLFGEPQPVFYESMWVRAESGGILLANVELGDIVAQGQLLGTVTDPIENKQERLGAPFRGRILGMAVNQVVMPGFAAFHIGRVASEELAILSTMQAGGSTDDERAGVTDSGASPAQPSGPADSADNEPAADGSPVPAVDSENSDTSSTPAVTGVNVPGIDSPSFDLDWLQKPETASPRACIRPPLIEC